MDYEQLARKILEEAAEVDSAEDERYGDKRGDELPEQLTTRHGRQAWLREAKRQLEAERAADPKPVSRARAPRLKEAKRRLEEELWTEQRANAAYEAWRARGISADGAHRMAPGMAKPYQPPETPAGTINTSDPDSRLVQTRRGFVQGYTAQAVATEDQILITADVITGGNERNTLEPLIDMAHDELEQAGISGRVELALADAGFWNTEQIERLAARGIRPLVNPDAGRRKTPGKTRRRRAHYLQMREQLASEESKQLYRRRSVMIEPIFGQAKHNRRADRFQRRGLGACRAEWRLIAATHNLLKLWRHSPTLAPA